MGDKRYDEIRGLSGSLEDFQLSNPTHSLGQLLKELALMEPPMSVYQMSDKEVLRRLARAAREAEKYGPLSPHQGPVR
jgi:hypothetical protein